MPATSVCPDCNKRFKQPAYLPHREQCFTCEVVDLSAEEVLSKWVEGRSVMTEADKAKVIKDIKDEMRRRNQAAWSDRNE